MLHEACARHQRDLENVKGEEGLPHLIKSPNLTTGYRKNNETPFVRLLEGQTIWQH